MDELPPLARNVAEFLAKTSDTVGRMLAERWDIDVFTHIHNGGSKSPIEQLFYIACKALCESEFRELNPEPDGTSAETLVWRRGVYLSEQHKIDQYRVDFLVSQEGLGPDDIYSPVIVELDGHDFHDKDKKQRAYEKARDRHLVRAGYRVLHFTGSEVCADPFRVAFEALDLVGLFTGTDRESYDPANPLAID